MMRSDPIAVGEGIWRVTGETFPSNTYVCFLGPECFLVDPGLDADPIDEVLRAHGISPGFVFCTHGHFDHAGSAAFFQKKYDARVFMHVDDIKTLKASNFLLMAFRIPCRIELPEVEKVMGSDFSMTVGGKELRYR